MSKVRFFYGSFLFLLCQLSVSTSQEYCGNLPDSTEFFWLDSLNVLGGETFTIYEAIRHVDQDQPGGVSIFINEPVFELSPLLNEFEFDYRSMPYLEGWTFNWQLWIDVNGDGTYDAAERFYQGSGTDQVFTQVDLSQYHFNEILNTRMRLMLSYDAWPEPCDQLPYGDIRDFQVEIQATQPINLQVPSEYATIQAAIDAASEGDHIVVNDGIYEEHLIIDKGITLESVNGADYTTITGSLGFHTIWVQAPDVTIHGFNLSGQRGVDLAGIYFDQGADRGRVYASDCGTNPDGVIEEYNVLVTDADHITVSGLECLNRGRSGIHADGTNNSSFSDNQLRGSGFEGIYLSHAYETILLNNVTNDNGRTGIEVVSSERTSVKHNDCSQNFNESLPFPNASNGIIVRDSYGTDVEGNTCHNNQGSGIFVTASEDTLILANELYGNNWRGGRINQTLNTEVYGNTFQGSDTGLLIDAFLNETFVVNNRFYDNQFGLVVNFASGSLFQGNDFRDNSSSMEFYGVQNSTIKENQFEPLDESNNPCKIALIGAHDNHLYLNNLNFSYSASERRICGNNSSNQWYSPHAVSYQFNGLDFESPLGNFYQWVDHTDLNADGIVDTPPELEFFATDNHSLSMEFQNLQF